MTITYSKYHGIGNEKLIAILDLGADADAKQELNDRGNDQAEIDSLIAELRYKASLQ